ncbi:uncharacterized protein LOC132749024 [Ruditapes philippinarum]|uniref:uncharacterized protein LOC132749024 n=1 Tax=Ruditapes philippinarum TaxID=129788 RepID=UPI00295A6DD1|nr:uncharacterized protein LOC132749024 [Ruditapes philippinarum]
MLEITTESNGNALPPILYIQADNCARENKNRYVLAFLQLLVEKNIFNEVHFSMLPVGHTHEDIDARFSLISRRLYQKDTETLEEFLNVLEKPMLIKTIHDVKSWLIPYIPKYISGISEPLHFKFEKIDGAVRSLYKGIHNEEWKEVEHGFLSKVPGGKPNIVSPDFCKIDEDGLFKLIEKNKSFFLKPKIF